MLIKRVELDNIKSYDQAVFDLEPGTTVVMGENGAGKTTLIEAIAWVLFDLLAYKKEDFIRRGHNGNGSVSVTFRSGLDERDYIVFRNTGTSYYVYDPALKLRIADKKEEVTRFLWQHLGVEPGTDLETLFKHAIGVPQGTFTAIFLATGAERKRTFDTLLKVEEYRRSADALLKTVRFVEARIGEIALKIARSETEVARIEKVEAERADASARVGAASVELGQLTDRIAEARSSTEALDRLEAKVLEITTSLERTRSACEKAEFIKAQCESEFAAAETSASVVAEVKVASESYTTALANLARLEGVRGERQKLRDKLAQIDTTEAGKTTEKRQFLAEIEKLRASKDLIASLRPLVAKQEHLESEVGSVRDRLARADAAKARLADLQARRLSLLDVYHQKMAELENLNKNTYAAGDLATLETRDRELLREVSRLHASIERDEAFQREIKNGLCPVLSEKCLNLKEGQTLDGFLNEQFGEMRGKAETLEKERKNIAAAILSSREAASALTLVPGLEARISEIKAEGGGLKGEISRLQNENADPDALKKDLTAFENELKGLDNPKARIAILERELAGETDLRASLSLVEKVLTDASRERATLNTQLGEFGDVETEIEEAAAVRDNNADAYRRFIANQALAGVLEERKQKLDAASVAHNNAEADLRSAETEYQEASKGYDRERHQKEKRELAEIEKREAVVKVMLEAAERNLKQLVAEIEVLETTRSQLRTEYSEKERQEKVREAVDFIRTTLKDAAPLVAKNYVWHVSQEANQMFREISGNAERTLKWGEEYDIVLEERGHERPFASLSGGEQMAAAISVRLALLKQLSDIRLAFFDEPTTNMDAERRENLAQQIGQIRHFDQLFVISHDDTFEAYVDHEIRIER